MVRRSLSGGKGLTFFVGIEGEEEGGDVEGIDEVEEGGGGVEEGSLVEVVGSLVEVEEGSAEVEEGRGCV